MMELVNAIGGLLRDRSMVAPASDQRSTVRR